MDSPTTSLAEVAAARREAQRAYLRQTSEDRAASPQADTTDTPLTSSPSMRLTDFLPLMRLRDSEIPRRRPQERLTNADIIATIEHVLDIVGDVEIPQARSQGDEVDPAVSS